MKFVFSSSFLTSIYLLIIRQHKDKSLCYSHTYRLLGVFINIWTGAKATVSMAM
jgi:hypothetical protein